MSEQPFKIINIDESNVDEYDLLCVKSKKSSEGYQRKLKWFKERLKEGMRFKLLLVHEGTRGYRSRGMIEYMPGEFSWRGISANDYMVIHCIWVVGRNKKKGYGLKLLERCYQDAQGMNGVAVVTSKNGHWLPTPKLFIKHGFELVDTVLSNFELYVKKFKEEALTPKFHPLSEDRSEEYGPGFTILKSDQCPYTVGAAKLVSDFAEKMNVPAKVIPITACSDAQLNGFHPYGTYCVLFNGEYLTYYSQNENGLKKLLEDKGI